MVVAVAEESRGAEHARPWIEQANSSYWQLIDVEHRLSDLYNLLNVPQAVWIDEQGRIVRPPETAGSTDHFRRMNLATRTLSPEDQAARLAARQAYLDAEGERQMDIASTLHPDSWSMWRQAADLDEVGKASGPAFWQRVLALGDRPYYPPPKL